MATISCAVTQKLKNWRVKRNSRTERLKFWRMEILKIEWFLIAFAYDLHFLVFNFHFSFLHVPFGFSMLIRVFQCQHWKYRIFTPAQGTPNATKIWMAWGWPDMFVLSLRPATGGVEMTIVLKEDRPSLTFQSYITRRQANSTKDPHTACIANV